MIVGVSKYHIEKQTNFVYFGLRRFTSQSFSRGSFLADVVPLLTAEEAAKFDAAAGKRAFASVFTKLIHLIPGKPWASTPKMIEEFKLQELME